MYGASPFPDAVPPDHAERLADSGRLEALRRTGLTDQPPEPAFDRAIRLARQITGASVGLLSLVDAKRQFFQAQAGLDGSVAEARETPLSHSFCQYVVTADRPLAVSDARAHALLRDNGAVADLGVTAYLGVPVHGPDGAPIGSFCAISPTPRDWTEDQLNTLMDLAAMIETEIRLAQSLRDRQLLVDELNHRVKNLFSLTLAMIRLSQREASDTPDFASILQNRVQALARAHDLILPAILDEADRGEGIALAELVETLVAPYDRGQALHATGPDQRLGPRSAGSLALALHELTTNAAKYGGLAIADGRLEISWRCDGDRFVIDWAETGRRPAETDAGPGFGSRLLRVCLEDQLGGALETQLETTGMRRRITLPLQRLSS